MTARYHYDCTATVILLFKDLYSNMTARYHYDCTATVILSCLLCYFVMQFYLVISFASLLCMCAHECMCERVHRMHLSKMCNMNPILVKPGYGPVPIFILVFFMKDLVNVHPER